MIISSRCGVAFEATRHFASATMLGGHFNAHPTTLRSWQLRLDTLAAVRLAVICPCMCK